MNHRHIIYHLLTNCDSSLNRLYNTLQKLRQKLGVLNEYEAVVKSQLESGVKEAMHALEGGQQDTLSAT